jgi:hypothetical protein
VKIKTAIGLTGATAASIVGMAGLAAGPAGAGGNGAVNMPAEDLTSYLGVPVPVIASPFVPPGTFPNVKVSGNCDDPSVSWLFTDIVGLDFQSGNAVVYQGPSGPVIPFLPGGLNAVGVATLDTLDPATFTATPTDYVGRAHIWFGQNANANGQSVIAETVTFTGTAPDGSTISFNTNPGGTTSASGHQSGWGQQNLSCNILPTG